MRSTSYDTIGNWMKMYGLDVYNLSGKSLKGQDYAEVIDESMMIGSEKLPVTLAVPSAHQGRPLCHSDVSVLDMSVSRSWTGEGVKAQLEKAAEKVGHVPEYVISDNASIMARGIRLSGINHHHDISLSTNYRMWQIVWKASNLFAGTRISQENPPVNANCKSEKNCLPVTLE